MTTFRKRRIAFRTLSRPLQVLLLLALAQIGVVALLLVTRDLPQPQLSNIGVISQGQSYVTPLPAFLVLAISSILGIWFALAGAMRVHWSVRFLVVALATALLAFVPIIELSAIANVHQESFVIGKDIRWVQLALLALYWLWAGGITLWEWRVRREGRVKRPWHGWTFWLVVVPILPYYSLDVVIWRVYAVLGPANAGVTELLEAIGSQVVILPFFLLLLSLRDSTRRTASQLSSTAPN